MENFSKKNQTIALNILSIKKIETCTAYISKINSNYEKNDSLHDSEWTKRRIALLCSKKLSSLLHEITSKHKDDFYCLSCLHFFRTENKLKSYEKVCKKKDFCENVKLSG